MAIGTGTVAGLLHRQRPSAEQAAAWAATAAVTAFVVWQLFPDLILRNTTPADGDLSGHLQAGRSLRDHLLPHGRLSGWSSDWFTGFPLYTFYFPLGSVLVAAVDLLVPYTVALKLVVAAGPIALPLSAYAFGRLNGCDRLTSACLAVCVLPLLLLSTLFLAGGSLAADAGGEYTYSLSLALGLLVVGLARAGLRTGRHRALTAGLLAGALLVHLVPTTMVVTAIVVATVLPPAWAKLRWSAPVLAVAGLLTGFWIVPFVLRSQFTAGIDDPKATPLLHWLFPVEMVPVVALAVVAVVTGSRSGTEERDGLRPFLIAMVLVSGAVFATVPAGRVWNGRFLAVWFLWLCLLAGFGLARLACAVDEWRHGRARGRALGSPGRARLLAPLVALAAFLPLYDSRDWRGLLAPEAEPAQSTTAKARFGGYERSASRAEYQGFIDTIRTVAREHGCGRAHTETAAGNWADLRLPLVWLSPLWTDGCITTTMGLYVQSSATSPAIAHTALRLSSASGPPEQGGRFDFAAGVAGLRTLGVRYFLATSPDTVRAADAHPDLRRVAQTKAYGERSWKVYKVTGVELVEPLRHLPVVVPGVGRSRTSWEAAVEQWSEADGGVVVAASGPAGWARQDTVSKALPRRLAPTATVRRVRIENERVSFDVSRTGVPILVKVSYFPNWHASGAEGPWRVMPNQMAVVPTSRTVTLRYGRTPVDHAGWLATLAGIGGLVVLARRRPVGMPEPSGPEPEQPPKTKAPRRPKQKRRRR